LWLGTLRDHSGNGNHATVGTGAPYWTTANGCDSIYSNDPGRLNIAAAESLEVGDITIFLSGDFRAMETEYMLRSVDGAGIYFYTLANTFVFHSGAVDSVQGHSIIGNTSIAVTATAAASKPLFYADGAYVGDGNVNTSVAVPSSNWYALGATASTGCKSPVSCIMMFPSVLTETEILSLHNWCGSRFSLRKQWPGGGLDQPSDAIVSPVFLDNIQTARVTLANETSGKLSNTDFSINSGTWAVAEDDDGKYLSCVGAGQLEYGLIGASGYTTDAFVETGGATLTKNATNFQIDAGNGDIVRAVRLSA
jgi:hypothetical protein